MPLFLDLPSELLQQVISVLAEEHPLSERLFREEPSESLLRSDYHPLKDLSQACRVLRELCFPSLYSAVKVDLKSIIFFFAFSKSYSLYRYIDSLVLYSNPDFEANHFLNHRIWLLIIQIMDSVKPSVMTMLLAPRFFDQLLPYDLDLSDHWAFSIRYQVLQLRMHRDLALASRTSREVRESLNVFRLREWTHCTFNQGSFINGYGSYEYFHKQAPSIFSLRNSHCFEITRTYSSFQNLTSLDYVAIFPIDHMRQFCMSIQAMRKLTCLRVQFAPTSNNNVLDNPAALGKCQPGDLWQEFEACYKTLTRYVSGKSSIGSSLIEEFVSLDYVNPSLREVLDRVVGHRLARWNSDPKGGRWTRGDGGPKEPDQSASN